MTRPVSYELDPLLSGERRYSLLREYIVATAIFSHAWGRRPRPQQWKPWSGLSMLLDRTHPDAGSALCKPVLDASCI